MDITVIHHYNGATKTARFEAPLISAQLVDGGIHVVLHREQGGVALGYALFASGGIVALAGRAAEQYGPLTEPDPTGT